MLKALAKRILLGPPLRNVFGALHAYLSRCDKENQDARMRSRYDIHPSAHWSSGTIFLGDGRIRVGARSYLGHDCHISSHPSTASVTIGSRCAIAHGVHIRTTNYARVPEFRDAFDMAPESADIVIRDDVWIGSHVYINAGVTVGSNVIIGANSVVTKDVPNDVVIGGVPARLIARKSEYATPRRPGRSL